MMNNIFNDFVFLKQIIVNEDDWADIVNTYSHEFIIKQLSDAIELYEIELPYREISIDEVQNEYEALLNKDKLICDGKWVNKFEYLYPKIDKYIGLSNVGNIASDYFHQVERWKCDATGYPSPQKTWENERFRLTLFKALFSLKVREINPQVFRNIISLRKYIAAQFRPSAAKAIYDYFQAETVLDFSMGWGDRILGAHASKYVKNYVGIDPNLKLLGGYVEQIKYYNSIGTPKNYSLHPACAEDPTLYLKDKFDLIFTSPPYFDKEKYDQSENQSYIKYKAFDSWMKDFLFKAIELRAKNLKSGGHLVINISDIYTRKKLYKICDGMNDYISSTNKFSYVGAMGLRMPKRPMSISSDTEGVFAEPIWIWKKK
jgi:hypothetical protein